MRRWRITAFVVLALLNIHVDWKAQAQDSIAITVIDDDAFRDFSGAAQLNSSAGDGNLQLNGAALALSRNGVGIATFSAIQRTDVNPDGTSLHAFARIEDGAFANAEGLIAVNQVSGRQNQLANLLVATFGLEGVILAEADLSQSRSEVLLPENFAPQGARQARVTKNAFRDASGVIQVNQVAGVSNSTFNKMHLTISGGLGP